MRLPPFFLFYPASDSNHLEDPSAPDTLSQLKAATFLECITLSRITTRERTVHIFCSVRFPISCTRFSIRAGPPRSLLFSRPAIDTSNVLNAFGTIYRYESLLLPTSTSSTCSSIFKVMPRSGLVKLTLPYEFERSIIRHRRKQEKCSKGLPIQEVSYCNTFSIVLKFFHHNLTCL